MTLTGGCHCGDTRFTIDAERPDTLTRCTCSFCAKRGMLWAYFPPARFRIETVQASDAVYRWKSGAVAHHHCPRCGCGTYSDSPDFGENGSWDGETRKIGVNARLFDDFDAAEAPVTVIDGKTLW